MTTDRLPEIIQGGMGAGVSNWELANSVARHGQLGVVSGTALDSVLVRRLQAGDIGGHMRRALSAFPWQEKVQPIIDKFFIEGGKDAAKAFKNIAPPVVKMSNAAVELLIVSNFVEIFLAKEGHDGPVGINYLQKIQLPNLPSIFGAMLAGVNYILMGAGIPLGIPGVLDDLSEWKETEMKIHVDDNPDKIEVKQFFDPKNYCPDQKIELKRPSFLAIITSHIVGKTMNRKANGYVNGFVVENHTAGGHNAPPRGKDAEGQPEFGTRDEVNYDEIRKLERPFWIAGSFASPKGLQDAKDLGAVGIQAGTIFAYSKESGIAPEIKEQVIDLYKKGELKVKTDFKASPTGYPFKVVDVGAPFREKLACDLGYLRQTYINDKGKVAYRCASEPEKVYIKKGGNPNIMDGKLCLCNGLLATIGLPQIKKNGIEPPLITSGQNFDFLENILKKDSDSYNSKDVIDYILS